MWGEGKGEEREETRSSSQEVKGTKVVSKQNAKCLDNTGKRLWGRAAKLFGWIVHDRGQGMLATPCNRQQLRNGDTLNTRRIRSNAFQGLKYHESQPRLIYPANPPVVLNRK